MTSWMNFGASARGFPVFCRVTAGGRPCSDPPEVTWKTRKSSLSHQVGPSSSYGSAFAINWIVAGGDVKPTIAIQARRGTVMDGGGGWNASTPVNLAAHTQVKRWGVVGSDTSSASSAVATTLMLPTGTPDTENVGLCAGGPVRSDATMPRVVALKPSTTT